MGVGNRERKCDRPIYSVAGRSPTGTGATGHGTPDNGGGAEALLPTGAGGLSHGEHASDAKDAGTQGLNAHREGGDETDSGAIDKTDSECGPITAAGFERVAVGRGGEGTPGPEGRD